LCIFAGKGSEGKGREEKWKRRERRVREGRGKGVEGTPRVSLNVH